MNKIEHIEAHEKLIIRTPIFPYNAEVDNKIFEDALFIASPNLYNKYNSEEYKDQKSSNNYTKLQLSITKYKIRSKYRPTPFGLFGLVGVGKWDQQGSSVLRDEVIEKSFSTHTSLDMAVIDSVCETINRLPEIKENCIFYPNNTLFKLGNTYRIIEYFDTNNRRQHEIIQFESNQYLDDILKIVKFGGTISDVISKFKEKHSNFLEEEVRTYLEELIDSQILKSEISPKPIGVNNLELVIESLEKMLKINNNKKINHLKKVLCSIKSETMNFDNSPISRVRSYNKIFQNLKVIIPEIEYKNILKVDSYVDFKSASIDKEISNKIKKVLVFLNKINKSQKSRNLDSFKNEFLSRYGDKQVPLTIALDADLGIVYGNKNHTNVDLLKNIFIDHTEELNNIELDPLSRALLKLLNKSKEEKTYVINIDENDFKNIDFSKDQLPATISVIFKVINTKMNQIQFVNAGGSSAINLLGRFTNGNQEILKIVNDIVRYENKVYKNKIVAELVHLPNKRGGNVINRAKFRKFEIPYVTDSVGSEDGMIQISDLYLFIKNSKLILWSKTHKKEIIPMMGCAHNFNFDSLPIYKFLCDLQTQNCDKIYLNFNWGNAIEFATFFPRVVYSGVIVSPAKWRFKSEHYISVRKVKELKSKKLFLNKFFKVNNIPNKLVLSQGDNNLYLDISKESDYLILLDHFVKKNSVNIEEWLLDDDSQLIRTKKNKKYTNQLIAVFYNKSNSLLGFQNKPLLSNKVTKEFLPGSEWIYFKIYCGSKSINNIFLVELYPLLKSLIESKIAKKWFFIRYKDPNKHIRLRVLVSSKVQFSKVITKLYNLFKDLIDNNFIYNISINSYQRELNRYGLNTIEYVETFFYIDSDLLVEVFDCSDKFIWQYALASVHLHLSQFGFDSNEKLKFTTMMADSFIEEHGDSKLLRVSLDRKYRLLREEIHSIISNDKIDEKLSYFLNKRDLSTRPIIEKFVFLKNKNELIPNYYTFVGSLIHMMINRLFIAKQRSVEMTIYYFLQKELKSNIARLSK